MPRTMYMHTNDKIIDNKQTSIYNFYKNIIGLEVSYSSSNSDFFIY